MPSNAFARIMAEYAQARQEPFGGHHLADFIRNDLHNQFRQSLPQYSQIL